MDRHALLRRARDDKLGEFTSRRAKRAAAIQHFDRLSVPEQSRRAGLLRRLRLLAMTNWDSAQACQWRRVFHRQEVALDLHSCERVAHVDGVIDGIRLKVCGITTL